MQGDDLEVLPALEEAGAEAPTDESEQSHVEGDAPPRALLIALEIARTIAVVAIALALVVIAVTQTRQLRLDERGDCQARAVNFRADTGEITPDFEARVREACHLVDPLKEP